MDMITVSFRTSVSYLLAGTSGHVSFPKASAFERTRKPEVELQIQIAASFHASLRNVKVEYCEPAE